MEEPLIRDEEDVNNDRELIHEYLVKVKECQRAIINMENNN